MSAPDAGLTEWLRRAAGLSIAVPFYVAVGTGTDAFSADDATLEAELLRVLASVTSVSGNVLTVKGFLNTQQANAVISEIGLLDGAAGGNLLDRTVLPTTQEKNATQEAIVEYAITLERG